MVHAAVRGRAAGSSRLGRREGERWMDILSIDDFGLSDNTVEYRERLGGILWYYHRAA